MNNINSLKVKINFSLQSYHPDNPAAKGQPPERLIHTLHFEDIPRMVHDLAANKWGNKEDDGIYIASALEGGDLWPLLDFDVPNNTKVLNVLIPQLSQKLANISFFSNNGQIIASGQKGFKFIPFFIINHNNIDNYNNFLFETLKDEKIIISSSMANIIIDKYDHTDLGHAISIIKQNIKNKKKKKKIKSNLKELIRYDRLKKEYYVSVLLFIDHISPQTPIALIRNRDNMTAQPVSPEELTSILNYSNYLDLCRRPFHSSIWAFYIEDLLNNLTLDPPQDFANFLKQEKEKQQKREKGKVISTTFKSIFKPNLYRLKTSNKPQIVKLIDVLVKKYRSPKIVRIKGKIKGYQWKKCPICGHRAHSHKKQNFTIWTSGRFVKCKCFSTSCTTNQTTVINQDILKAMGLSEHEINDIMSDNLTPKIKINQTHHIMPLSQTRVLTKQTIDSIINEGRDAIVMAGTGTGKTTSILYNLDVLHAKNKLTVICAPTNDLVSEQYHQAILLHPELANKMVKIEPKSKYCYHPELLQKAIELNLPENVVCGKCAHHPHADTHTCNYSKCAAIKDKYSGVCQAFQQYSKIRTDSIIFCTHDIARYLFTILKHLQPEIYEEYQGGNLIIDEVDIFVQRLVYEFSWHKLKTIYSFLNEYTIDTAINNFLDSIICLHHNIKPLLSKKELLTIDNSWTDYQQLQVDAKECLKGLLEAIGELAIVNPKLKTKVDDIKALLWDIFIAKEHNLEKDATYVLINNKIKDVCYEIGINYDAFNLLFALLQNKLLIHIDSKSIFFTVKRRLSRNKLGNPSQTILMDATACVEALKYVFDWLDDPEELKVWPKREGKIINLKDIATRKHIKKALNNDNSKYRQLDYAISMAQRLTIGNTAWIAPNVDGKMNMIRWLECKTNNINITYHYSPNTRGSNNYDKIDTMVIIGAPIAQPKAYILTARTLFNDDDEIEEAYRQWMPHAQMIQTIGRHRQLFNNPNARLILIAEYYNDEILNVVGAPDLCLHNPLSNPKASQKLSNAYLNFVSSLNSSVNFDIQTMINLYKSYLIDSNTDSNPEFNNRIPKYLKTFMANNILLPLWRGAWLATCSTSNVKEPTAPTPTYEQLPLLLQQGDAQMQVPIHPRPPN